MSKKDKKLEPKKEPKKENAPVQEESQESKLAKQIIDLQASIEQKNKDLEAARVAIDQARKKEIAMGEAYKDLLAQAEKKANELIKNKIDENDAKFKRELTEAKKYAIKDAALDLIDIIAEFSAAINHPVTDPKIANWLSGFKMYLTKFNNLLNDLHIQQIVVNEGQEFDPNIMEPFETVADATKPDNTVVTILKPGYKLYDHILKPVLVKVIKNK